MVHLIDGNDTINAKFLFQRVSEGIRRSSSTFTAVWNVVKSLAKNEFGTALNLLRQPLADIQGANPLIPTIEPLRAILVWHLEEHTVPELIADTYSNIEYAKVNEMLGQSANLN